MSADAPKPSTPRTTGAALERPRIPYVLLITLAIAGANVAAVVLSFAGQ